MQTSDLECTYDITDQPKISCSWTQGKFHRQSIPMSHEFHYLSYHRWYPRQTVDNIYLSQELSLENDLYVSSDLRTKLTWAHLIKERAIPKLLIQISQDTRISWCIAKHQSFKKKLEEGKQGRLNTISTYVFSNSLMCLMLPTNCQLQISKNCAIELAKNSSCTLYTNTAVHS